MTEPNKRKLIEYPAILVLAVLLWSPFLTNLMLGVMLVGIIVNFFDKKYILSVINSKYLWIILSFLFTFVIYSLITKTDFFSVIKNKNMRLLLIPFVATCFNEDSKKILAIKVFTASMVLYSIVNIAVILSVGQIYEYFTKKTILASMFVVFTLIGIYFIDLKNNYKLFNNKKITWAIITILLLYLFVFCNGRTGQVLCLLVVSSAILSNFNIQKIILLFSILFLCIAFGLNFSPDSNFSTRAKLAYNETKLFFEKDNYNDTKQYLLKIEKGNKININKIDNLNYLERRINWAKTNKYGTIKVNKITKEGDVIFDQKYKFYPGEEITIFVSKEALSMVSRLEFYKYSLKLFLQKPLLGWGFGNFEKSYNSIAKDYLIPPSDNPHNQYLLILTEMGIYGLLCFLLFLFAINFHYRSEHDAIFSKILYSTSAIYLVGFLVNSFFIDFQTFYLFIMIVGIFGACNKYPSESKI